MSHVRRTIASVIIAITLPCSAQATGIDGALTFFTGSTWGTWRASNLTDSMSAWGTHLNQHRTPLLALTIAIYASTSAYKYYIKNKQNTASESTDATGEKSTKLPKTEEKKNKPLRQLPLEEHSEVVAQAAIAATREIIASGANSIGDMPKNAKIIADAITKALTKAENQDPQPEVDPQPEIDPQPEVDLQLGEDEVYDENIPPTLTELLSKVNADEPTGTNQFDSIIKHAHAVKEAIEAHKEGKAQLKKETPKKPTPTITTSRQQAITRANAIAAAVAQATAQADKESADASANLVEAALKRSQAIADAVAAVMAEYQ